MITQASNPACFDANTPLNEFVTFVDAIKANPQNCNRELTLLLSVGHPFYEGRRAIEILKLRAHVMAALEFTDVPETAIPYIRENLESSLHPYSVAAAACALRGIKNPDPQLLKVLFHSIFNIWQHDRPVNFEKYHSQWPMREVDSGVTEVLKTIAHFGRKSFPLLSVLEQLTKYPEKLSHKAHANLLSCIKAIQKDVQNVHDTKKVKHNGYVGENIPGLKSPQSLKSNWPPNLLELQDQDGAPSRWSDFFGHKPTLIGFFYTRCGNPNKCTRTILNLARVQEKIKQRGLDGLVRICAVSYDAQFDTSTALRSYGVARGFCFGDDYKMFRVSKNFDKLVELMKLEVSFADNQVTSHRIELFILNSNGEIVQPFLRLQSEAQTVADSLTALVKRETI